MATDTVASMTLVQLITKQETDGGLTAEEHNRLLFLLSTKTAASKEAATKAGILVLSDVDTKTLATIAENYSYQTFGQLAWSELMLRNTCDKYNSFAIKNKLPQCSDWRKLGDVLNALPVHFHTTLANGAAAAEARYIRAWESELTKLAAAHDAEDTAGTPHRLHGMVELTRN